MENSIITANELTNVKDIKDTIIYTKDNYLISLIRVHFFNIDLLSNEGKRSITKNLSSSFEGDKKDFAYVTYPREIDLDTYKDDLKRRYSEEINKIGKKRLLKDLLLEANELASSGENYEHQHFLKIWRKVTHDLQNAESSLRIRVEEFKSRYESVGINVEILKEQEILKMCNLFGNSVQAPYTNIGNNTRYEPITTMREIK